MSDQRLQPRRVRLFDRVATGVVRDNTWFNDLGERQQSYCWEQATLQGKECMVILAFVARDIQN